jgi:DNA-binding transcriptional ArsR family regulator
MRTFTSPLTPPRKESLGVKVAGPMQLALDLHLRAADPCYILNPMVQFQRAHLDASFAALSDATRRGILERLGRADASITDLAEKFHMTLTGMKKHVGVLEQAGLVTTEKVTCVPASSGYAAYRKRRHGLRGTASSGTHASTSWTRSLSH